MAFVIKTAGFEAKKSARLSASGSMTAVSLTSTDLVMTVNAPSGSVTVRIDGEDLEQLKGKLNGR